MKRENWLAVLIAIIVVMGMSGCVDELDNFNSQDTSVQTKDTKYTKDTLPITETTYPSIEIPEAKDTKAEPEKLLIDIKAEPGYGDKPEEFYVRESEKYPENNLEQEHKIEYCVLSVKNTKEHLALSWKLYDKNGKLTNWQGNFIVQVEIWEYPDPSAPNPFENGLRYNPILGLPNGIDYPDGKFWIRYDWLSYLNQKRHEGDVKSWITLRDSGKVLHCGYRPVNLGHSNTNAQTPATTSTGQSQQQTTTSTTSTGPSYEAQARPNYDIDEELDKENDKKKSDVGKEDKDTSKDKSDRSETKGLLGFEPGEDGTIIDWN